MEIIKSNSLIANFMGWKFKSNSRITNPIDSSAFYQHKDFRGFYLRDMQYHQSWDWLMPVVIKLQEIAGQYSLGKINNMFGLDFKSDNIEKCFIGTPNINEVYESVIDFIIFYNEQTNNNGQNSTIS